MTRGISAVVCCYNSETVIESTLLSLARQVRPRHLGFEVILVDNASTDHTVNVAQQAWGVRKLPPLRIVRENQPGVINARRAGVFAAQHDVVLFVDDDNALEDHWITRLDQLFTQHPKVGAIGGCNKPVFKKTKPDWFDLCPQVFACGPQHPVPGLLSTKHTLFGAGLAFRTQILKAIFSDELPLLLVGHQGETLTRGDDSELCLRAVLFGWDLWYEDTLHLDHRIHPGRLCWEYVMKAVQGGGAASLVLRIYQKLIGTAEPPDYQSRMAETLAAIEESQKTDEELGDHLSRPSSASLAYNFNQGARQRLVELGPSGYAAMREMIIRRFAMGKERLL